MLSSLSNTRDNVSSHLQTRRRGLKKYGVQVAVIFDEIPDFEIYAIKSHLSFPMFSQAKLKLRIKGKAKS